MNKKIIHLIFNYLTILICSIQLPLSTIPSRFPASWGNELPIEDLKQKLVEYKEQVNGKDVECDNKNEAVESVPSVDEIIPSESNKVADLNQSSAPISINSCEELGYSYDEVNENSDELQSCKAIHHDGIIDTVAKQSMLDEKAGKKSSITTIQDKIIRSLHTKGSFLKGEVEKTLVNESLNINEQRDLLALYIESVLVSFRDFMVIRRSYLPHEYNGEYFINSLIPEFPSELVPDIDSYANSIIAGKILLGPDPQTSPWNLKLERKMWGVSTISFDPLGVLSRDISTLLRAPTKSNYVRGLKWMSLQMMLGQVQLYSSMRGEDGNVEIPRSCQNHFNGELPDTLNLQVRDGEGDSLIENILVNAGLAFSSNPNASDDISERSEQFIEYFVSSIDSNPMESGYSGLMPFEDYKNAQIGIKQAKGRFLFSHKLEPAIDDMSAYQYILNTKGYDALEVFKSTKDDKSITYNGLELFQKLLMTPNTDGVNIIKDENGLDIEIDTDSQNLSTYLFELMKSQKVTYFEDIIPENVKHKLEDREVLIDFPKLYGAASLRNWGLQRLNEAFELAYSANANELKNMISKACNRAKDSSVCVTKSGRSKSIDSDKSIDSMRQFLNEYGSSIKFIPEQRYYEKNVNSVYPALTYLWKVFRDETDYLPLMITNEYDLLISQMEAGNPWARLRLSYLLLTYELHEQLRGGNGGFYNTERRCNFTNLSHQSARIAKAARKLNLHKVFNLNHGNRLLSKDEKIEYWQKLVGDTNQSNSELFQTKFENDSDLYSRFEEVSYNTFLKREHAENYVANHLSDYDSSDASEIFDSIENSEIAVDSDFFYELYNFKGSTKEKIEFFASNRPEEYQDDAEYAKLVFLMLDNSYKKGIYRSLIREAARIKKENVIKKLDEFCSLEPSDHRNFRKIFYSTTKAQNYLNQLAGIPAVPDSVIEQAESLSPEESQDLFIGLAQMGLMISSAVLGGACTVVSGGLCAPIGMAVTASSFAAVSSQMWIFKRELDRKMDADQDEKFLKEYENIGLSDLSSVDKMHKTWFFPVFEAVSAITFVGTVTRGIQVGSKLTKESAKALFKGTDREAFRKIVSSVSHKSDTRLAESVLKYNSLKKTSKVIKNSLSDPMHSLALFKQGKISKAVLMESFKNAGTKISKELSKEALEVDDFARSIKAVDRRTMNVVSEYWNNDPKKFAKFLSQYDGKIVKAKKALKAAEYKSGIVYNIPLIGKAKAGFQNLRYKNLVKYADKIQELKQLAASSDDLASLIKNNMDDLTDIFTHTGFRKREIPYMVLLQGGPHVGGINAGKRLPFFYAGADAFMMKKFFSARGVLVYDAFKTSAKAKLGLPLTTNIASTTSDALSAFQESIQGLVKKSSQIDKKKIFRQYIGFENKMIDQVHLYLQAQGTDELRKLSKSELKKMIFSAQTLEAKAMSETIINQVPVEALFDIEGISDLSYRAAKELSTENQSIDSFGLLLQALKSVSIQKEIIPVEYM